MLVQHGTLIGSLELVGAGCYALAQVWPVQKAQIWEAHAHINPSLTRPKEVSMILSLISELGLVVPRALRIVRINIRIVYGLLV